MSDIYEFLDARYREDEDFLLRSRNLRQMVWPAAEHPTSIAARLLDDLAVKRAILTHERHDHPPLSIPLIVRVLAFPYRTHPDYRYAWQPVPEKTRS